MSTLRMWTILTPQVACLRMAPRPQKYANSDLADNFNQYHSGCIVNVKIWKDVPEKIPCTVIGSLCIELLPTSTPVLSNDYEVRDDVAEFPPCSKSTYAGPHCTTPNQFTWGQLPWPIISPR